MRFCKELHTWVVDGSAKCSHCEETVASVSKYGLIPGAPGGLCAKCYETGKDAVNKWLHNTAVKESTRATLSRLYRPSRAARPRARVSAEEWATQMVQAEKEERELLSDMAKEDN